MLRMAGLPRRDFRDGASRPGNLIVGCPSPTRRAGTAQGLSPSSHRIITDREGTSSTRAVWALD